MSDTLGWLFGALTVMAGIFCIFIALGLTYGIAYRLSDDYIPEAIIRHTTFRIAPDSVHLEFYCGGKTLWYEYNVDSKEVAINKNQRGSKGFSIDAIPISKELSLSLLGGASGGYTLKSLATYFEKRKIPKTGKLARLIGSITSVVGGYGMGFSASRVFEPECRSESLRDKLSTKEFWQKAVVFALSSRAAAISICLDKAGDLSVNNFSNMELDQSLRKTLQDIILAHETLRNSYSDIVLVDAVTGATSDEIRETIRDEESCQRDLNLFSLLSRENDRYKIDPAEVSQFINDRMSPPSVICADSAAATGVLGVACNSTRPTLSSSP